MAQQQITHKDRHFRFEALALALAMVSGGIYVALKTALETTGPWMFLLLLFLVAMPVPTALALWLERDHVFKQWRQLLRYCWLPGLIATTGSILLQLALVTSAVGKAGLLSSLYVCILPFVSCFFGYKLKLPEIAAAFVAVTGVYFLAVTNLDGQLSIGYGDLLLILSALCWTAEIITIDVALRHVKPFSIAVYQGWLGVLVLLPFVPLMEPASVQQLAADFAGVIMPLAAELLYCGLLGGGVFALWMVVQKHVSPNRAGLLASMESLFAVLLGYLLLGETSSQRELLGMGLMVAALFIIRIPAYTKG